MLDFFWQLRLLTQQQNKFYLIKIKFPALFPFYICNKFL